MHALSLGFNSKFWSETLLYKIKNAEAFTRSMVDVLSHISDNFNALLG